MMAGIETSQVLPTSATPRRRTLRRRHAINLCCAQSVAPMVEEIARNLSGLGFKVGISCGAEARAALLGHAHAQQPTIHVVCVQGSLQERVLKPLRQALAQRGEHDQHLFVAVLDLSVPLTMVGHIRRFAEALERVPAAKGRTDETGADRRRWRESFGHRELAERPTRNYPTVTARRTTGKRPVVASDAPRRARSLSSRHRATRIRPTGRNQALTAPQTIIPVASVEPPTPKALGRLVVPPPPPLGRTSAAPTVVPPPRVAVTPPAAPTVVPPPRVAATPPVARPVAPTPPPRIPSAPSIRPRMPTPARIGAVADAIVAAHEAVKARVAETKKRVEAAVVADADATDAAAHATPTADAESPPATRSISGEWSVVPDASAPPEAASLDARSGDIVPAPRVSPDDAPARQPAVARAPSPPPSAPFAAVPVVVPVVVPRPAPAPKMRPPRPIDDAAHPSTAAAIAAVRSPARWPWLLLTASIVAGVAWWRPWVGGAPTADVATAREDVGTQDSNASVPSAAPATPALPPAAAATAHAAAVQPSDDAAVPDEPAAPDSKDAIDDAVAPGDAEEPDDDDDADDATANPAVLAEGGLADALARHEVAQMDRFFVTRRRGSATSWSEARHRCATLQIDGVGDWRLPWRRELKFVAAAGHLREGVFWSGSTSESHPDAVYAWSTTARTLEVFLKQEVGGEVVCVKRPGR
jgi:hypothetical protein